MLHRVGGAGKRGRPRTPPPTAHRLAAWLSLAQGLTGAPAKEVRFPPSEDDLQALQTLWAQRVTELRSAGVASLQNPRVYERALGCKPHAFSYAGAGEVCRLLFCPFCQAAGAAAAYERVRRATVRSGDVEFLFNRAVVRVRLADLQPDLPAVLEGPAAFADAARPLRLAGSTRGALVKYAAWPHERKLGQAVVTLRVLAAVPRQQAQLLWEAREASRELGGGLSYRAAGLTDAEVTALDSGDCAVRPCPLSIARAVAHLYCYPAALLTAPAGDVAAVLNATAGARLSAVRGVFRGAMPLNPRLYPRQWVPTRRDGAGVALSVAPLLPQADEGLAARELARALGLPPADTFTALSLRLGVPLYWLGRLDLSVADLVRPTKRSGLWQAVAASRPPRPGGRHALVGLSPGLGLIVLSTWPAVRDDFTDTTLVLNARLRGQRYTLETGDSFARRVRRVPAPGRPGAVA